MARGCCASDHLTMRYRHEQMIRARERRREAWHRFEAAVWGSMTAEERRLWRCYSEAVAQVRPA